MAQLNFFFFTTRSTYMVNVSRFFFLSSPSILTPPHGTKRQRTKSKTCCPNGPRPIFFPFLFLSRHLVAQGEISRYTALSVLVAQSRSPRHTAQSVPDRFLFLFYTTSWNRACRSPRRVAQTGHISMWPDKQPPNTTVRPQRSLNDPRPSQGTSKKQ